MKLALFSQNITTQHRDRLALMAGKSASEVTVCFITTPANYKFARGDSKVEWLERNKSYLDNYFAKVEEFDIASLNADFDFKQYFTKFDIVFVSGGNLSDFVYFAHITGVDRVLKKLIKDEKIVYAGGSAGALFLMEDLSIYNQFEEPVLAKEVRNKGIGLIKFAPLVHWGDDKWQSVIEQIKEKYEEKGASTMTITNNEAVFVEGDKVEKL